MRQSCLVSCALALVWAGAADACCLLKCFKGGGRSAVAAAPIFAPAPLFAPAPPTKCTELEITSVGGHPVQSGQIGSLIDSKSQVVIIVQGPLPCDPDVKLVFDPPLARPIRVVREQTTDCCVYKFIVEAESLKAGTTYKLHASNKDGSSTSAVVTFTTKP